MRQYTIYIIRDSFTIEALVNDDLDAFREAIADDLSSEVEVESFNSEAEALAFCAGLGHGSDERAIPEVYPLRSFESCDADYVEILTNNS